MYHDYITHLCYITHLIILLTLIATMCKIGLYKYLMKELFSLDLWRKLHLCAYMYTCLLKGISCWREASVDFDLWIDLLTNSFPYMYYILVLRWTWQSVRAMGREAYREPGPWVVYFLRCSIVVFCNIWNFITLWWLFAYWVVLSHFQFHILFVISEN